MTPVGSICPFGTGNLEGYWMAPEEEVLNGVAVPGVQFGEKCYVRVVVWNSRYGSIEDAYGFGYMHSLNTHGSSSWFEVVAGNPGNSIQGIPVPEEVYLRCGQPAFNSGCWDEVVRHGRSRRCFAELESAEGGRDRQRFLRRDVERSSTPSFLRTRPSSMSRRVSPPARGNSRSSSSTN